MITTTEAYNRGFAAGKAIKADLDKWMANTFKWMRGAYPASAHLDYAAEMEKIDRERLERVPSLTKFPETKGLPDIVRAERRGFVDATGAGPREVAYQFSWFFYCSRRLNAHYVGVDQRPNNCTAVYIRNSKEGGPLRGRNLDDIRRPGLENFVPPQGTAGGRKLRNDGVSSAVLCDDEPTEMYPVQVWDLLPPDCKRVKDIIPFLERYNEFWGPQNTLLVDEYQDVVAVEKSNCRMGVRWSDDGAAAVTACSYLIPEMKKFREERHRLSLKRRGWDETSSDWQYWLGCDARYHRLLKLTAEANARGATLADMANIVTDHAVPFPERICLAGERGHPDEPDVNWTLTSQASVLEGPNRRSLFWRVEGNTACYNNPPFLIPGEGVEVKPEWKTGTRSAE